jgi:hypothetical protein
MSDGADSVTFEEMEAQMAQPAVAAPVDVATARLEGDHIPAHLRGKTVAEIMQQTDALQQALRISEQARLAVQPQAPAVAPVPAPEPEKTKEEMSEWMQSDPIAAMEYIEERAAKRIMAQVEGRLAPLVSGTSAQIEQQMRTKYSAEFAVLGDDIQQIIRSMPNAQQMLANQQVWEDLISYARGKPGNFEKVVAQYQGRSANPAVDARAAETVSAGFTGTSVTRAPVAASSVQLDSTQKDICRVLGISEADYIKNL